MSDINDPISSAGQIVQGCAQGFHDLDSQSADFRVDGDRMLVRMRCIMCGQMVERVEAGAALIPDFKPSGPVQKKPVEVQKRDENSHYVQQEKAQERAAVPYVAAKESDEFWDSLK